MEEQGETMRRVELKICERCGGLWLRPGGSTWAYCRPCKYRMDELPAGRLKLRKTKFYQKKSAKASGTMKESVQ